jgi:hypothetical protein
LRIDASGEQQTRLKAASVSGYEFVLNVGAPNQVVGLTSDSFGSGPANFWSSVLKDQEVQLSPTYVNLFKLTSFSTTYDFRGASAALDAQQGLFVVGGSGQSQLSAVVIASDGSAAAEPSKLITTGSFYCRALQPTESAGAVSVVELTGEGESFHLVELTATGAVAWDVRVPLHRARPLWWNGSALLCPYVAPSQSGIAFLTFESGAAGDAWHLHRLNRDGTVSDEVWETLSDVPRGIAIQGQVAIAITAKNDGPVTAVKRSNGQDQQFPLALEGKVAVNGTDGPFPAEAGALFLDVTPGSPTGPSSRQIAEISCP